MYSVVPTSAARPSERDFHTLLASAKATVDAVSPFLTQRKSDGSAAPFAIHKVASCQHFYSALLRSDGVLLLLTTYTARGSLSSSSTATLTTTTNATAAAATTTACAARVAVLESGGEAVVDVAAGASHLVYCTASGAVYTCGYDNTYGQLGDGTVWSSPTAVLPASEEEAHRGDVAAMPQLSTPKRVGGFGDGDAAATSPTRHVPPPCSRPIRQVACGAHHTLLLTQTGRCVYACGRGDRGELGGARAVLAQPIFRSISLLFGLEMRQVAAADAHSFALLESGLLYAFGDNVCGQLGMGNTKRVTTPTLVLLSGQEASTPEPPQQKQTPSTSAAVPNAAVRRAPLDDKAYASLRAPYGSAESTYYPLRVPRLRADVATRAADAEAGSAKTLSLNGDLVDASVRWVHCCGSWTLLETDRADVWLSCGSVLTRGVSQLAETSRIDGCGVLGRPLLHHSKAEAYRFAPVLWPALLGAETKGNWEVKAAPPGWARGDGEASGEVDGVAYTHYTTATSEGLAFHDAADADPRHRGSDTVLSLCHTKKTVGGGVRRDGAPRVYPYATSLLVVCEAEDSWSGPTGRGGDGVVSKLLVQSGAPSAAAVEVSAADPSTWAVVAGTVPSSDADAYVNEASSNTPSGASLLCLRSSHGQCVPLPSYALFL